MRAAVSDVATYFPTAIISGRSREKVSYKAYLIFYLFFFLLKKKISLYNFLVQVKDFVKLNNLYYAGSHGMDIMAPSGPIRSSDGNQCYNNTLDTNVSNSICASILEPFLIRVFNF